MKIQIPMLGIILILGLLFGNGCDDSDSRKTSALLRPLTAVTGETFDEVVLKSDKPVLVDFWAPWCGPCLKLMPTLEEMAATYQGKLVIAKVNTDNEKELVEKYRVGPIPRLIFFHKGEVVIDEGSRSREGITKEIEAILKLK